MSTWYIYNSTKTTEATTIKWIHCLFLSYSRICSEKFKWYILQSWFSNCVQISKNLLNENLCVGKKNTQTPFNIINTDINPFYKGV